MSEYQTTPVLLPGAVTTDFDGGVASAAQAPQILEGSGDPTGVVSASVGSFFTDTNTGDVYSNPDGTAAGWVVVGGANPMTTKGDIYGFSTLGIRIPVGANGKVLTAKSSVAAGVEWDDIPAPDLSAYETIAAAASTYKTKLEAFNRTFVNQGLLTDGATVNFTAGPLWYLPMDTTPTTPFTTFTVSINTTAVEGTYMRFVFPAGCAALTVIGQGSLADVADAPAAAVAGHIYEFVFDPAYGAHGTWYRIS